MAIDMLSVNYYDSYNFLESDSIPVTGNTGFDPLTGYGEQSSFPPTGMLTGTLTAQLTDEGTQDEYLYAVVYYDNKGRIVQSVSGNHLGGMDREYLAYNFSGQPTKRRLVHTVPNRQDELVQVYSYFYDHAGRLEQTEHELNGRPPVVLAENQYDELGRVQDKRYHGDVSQTNRLAYAYNVRSWLTGINSYNFSQDLFYNTGSSTPLYSGNISSMTWKAGEETTVRGYKFSYDSLSRLTDAIYGEGNAIAGNNKYGESPIYDKHGNILAFERYDNTTAKNLSLTYTGNQLTGMSDGGNTGNNTYTYDSNGNLFSDNSKNITGISYNSLNLPAKVSWDNTKYTAYVYDAAGGKRQVTHRSGSITKTTDYCGSVIYEDGVIKRILTEEGYITLAGTTPTYYYYLKDHLGNNRVVIDSEGAIQQANHYYPFGGMFAETNPTGQPYKFGGKEFDTENGLDLYDFHARQMEPMLGRFTTMDPMAEKYYNMSPYGYTGNNPMIYIDPTGMDQWRTSNQDEIERVLLAMRTGEQVDTESFGDEWTRTTDEELAEEMAMYDDETNEYFIDGTPYQDFEGYGMNQEGFDLGYKNLVGPSMILLGRKIKLLKSIGALGSTSGSSIASYVLSKTLPINIGKKGSSIAKALTGSKTTNLGRFIGRMVPGIGWGLTATDISNTFVAKPNIQQIQKNIVNKKNPLSGTVNPTTGEYYVPGYFSGFRF